MKASADLDRIAAAIRAASGICLGPRHYPSLDAAFERAIGPMESIGLDAALRPGGDLLQRLVDEVAVKETTFLRDRGQLETIDWHQILRHAVLSGRGVCIWSAGCATGEEAYSLALLACEAFPLGEPPFRIVGTDLSATAIEAARRGRYRERALRDVDDTLRARYFSREGNEYVVGSRLRELVTFERHNMVTDFIPPASVSSCSFVICRNVFIYFEPATVDAVLAAFHRTLADDGFVLLGAADALVVTKKKRPDVTVAPKAQKAPEQKDDARHKTSRATRSATAVESYVAAALEAASAGRHTEALKWAVAAIDEDSLNSHALFVRGFIELLSAEPNLAVLSLRAALYADPTFGLAAFMLGRAHDACGDRPQGRRAYERSLRVIESGDRRHDYLLAQVHLDDVAAACRIRLAAAS